MGDEESIVDLVDDMIRLKIPTVRDFTCPVCGGSAHVQASPALGRKKGLLNVSTRCDDCGAACESCGVAPWKGWEVIRREG